jgi:hypothetical protein
MGAVAAAVSTERDEYAERLARFTAQLATETDQQIRDRMLLESAGLGPGRTDMANAVHDEFLARFIPEERK